MSSSVERGRGKASLVGLEILRLLALFLVLLGQMYVASRTAKVPLSYCLTRPMWLDEFHTFELVKEHRPDQLLYKLSRGADYNPPTLHLALWAVSSIVGHVDEFVMRAFTCAVGLCGLIAAYFLLRLRFTWLVSWVAVLGMWSSSPLLVNAFFDARFYSSLFSAAAILCLLMNLRGKGGWQILCVALAAAFLCTVHYFGILALGIIAVAQFVSHPRDARQRRLVLTALIGGVVALLACAPLYLGQRSALPVPTWIAPPTLWTSREFIAGFLLSYAFAIPVLVYVVQTLLGWAWGNETAGEQGDFRPYLSACALFLLPIVLIVFSYLVQPAYMPRYAIAAVVAYAPIIALVGRRVRPSLLAVAALCFAVVGVAATNAVYTYRTRFQEASSLAAQIVPERPLVMHSRQLAYPLFLYAGLDPHACRISFLFRGERLSRFDAVESAVTRRMAELFPLPPALETEELSRLNEFYLLAEPGEQSRYQGWSAKLLPLLVKQDPSANRPPLQCFEMTRSR
jgi:hypothetical protein